MAKHFRYFFNDGFGLVPTAQTKEVRKQLLGVFGPTCRASFYLALRDGVRDIRMPLYEGITTVLTGAGVPIDRIWRKVAEEDE